MGLLKDPFLLGVVPTPVPVNFQRCLSLLHPSNDNYVQFLSGIFRNTITVKSFAMVEARQSFSINCLKNIFVILPNNFP